MLYYVIYYQFNAFLLFTVSNKVNGFAQLILNYLFGKYEKEKWMDAQEEQRDKRLANIVGINYDELMQLEHELHEETDNDENIIALIVAFSKVSPKHILEK